MTTTYRITVVTGTPEGAGTDADVYITLYGSNGNSGERELDNGDDNFENGNTDVFILDRIVVHNEATDQEWTFPCARWLARDEDDGQIDRLLDAA
jgi:hypothetical protein